MSYDIGPKIGIEGEKQYKQAISGINKDMAVLGSEIKKVTAQFDGNANSMDALRAKSEVYNKQIDTQKNKIENLKAALENSTKEFGENSNQVKNWQIKLNNAEADLAKTEKALGNNEKAIKDFGKAQIQAAKDSEEFKKAQDKLAGAMKVVQAAALAVVGAVAAIGGASLVAAMDLEATEAKYLTVFEGMEEQADSFIKEFQKLTPATKAEARSFASGIQDLLVPMGFAREEATNLTGETLHLVGALTNFNSGTETAESVSGKFQAALTGSYEGLKSLGIQVDTNTVKLKAVEMGLADSTKEVDKSAQAQALLQLAYEQSGDALNAYNEENLDTKTKMLLLKASFTDTAAEIGAVLLPIVNDMMEAFREFIEKLDIEKITAKITDFINTIVENKDKILAAIASIAAGLLAWNVVGIIQSLIGAMKIWRAATEGMALSQKILNLVLAANPIGIVITAIAALTAGLVILWNTNEDFRNSVIEAWEKLKDAASGLWETIKQFFTVDIPGAFKAVLDFIQTNWQSLLLLILNPFAGAISLLYDLNPKFKAWVDDLLAKFKGWIRDFVDIGKNIVRGVWEGIQAMAAWFKEKISGFFGGIVDGVKGLLGIKSPSKVFAQIGSNMAQGLGQGFSNEMNSVARQINSSVPGVEMNSTYNDNTQMSEAIVNGLAPLVGGQGGGKYTINLIMNDKTIASLLFDPLQNIARQKGVALGG